MEKVTIDYNRLCLELEKQGKTKADLSRDMTKNKNFVGLMEKNPDQPAEVERLMCLLLGLEQGSLIKQEEATGSQGEIKILENLHKEMREIHQAIIEYGELIEKIWSKVHANTLQLEKVKEDVKECAQVLKMTDYDKAVRFLKETLAGGRIDGAEVLRMADATGIKRADGLKEKNGELVNANGDVVSSLSDIKKSADGTREGIAILNGTPCEVKVNKDGTIADLRAIDEEANNATRARTLSITLATNAITSGINAAISAAQGYSHYNGLDNVPYDGYQAVLHKGERVLTAEENKAYSNDPGIDYNKMEKCMKSAVRELTLSVGSRELGRIMDEHLRERGIL